MINRLQRGWRAPRSFVVMALSTVLGLFADVSAQQRGRGGPGQANRSARDAAPIDLTGQWVSVITEDYRFRMVTPSRGDYTSVPLTAEGTKVADGWNLAADRANGNQCKAFGAAALLRLPTRIRISWVGDNTLKLETDAGSQTRLFKFATAVPAATPSPADPSLGVAVSTVMPPRGTPSLQGSSVASWEAPRPGGGSLKVVTADLLPGYLRKNGVPYSEKAVVTEYFDRHTSFGTDWITVTNIVDDPKYLTQPFVTSSSFKRETSTEKWHPSGCEYD